MEDNVATLEQELIEAIGVKPKKGEKRPDFLARLAAKADEIDDGDWEEMSKPAQDWANAALKAINKKKAVADIEEPDEDADDDDAEGEAPAKSKAKAKGRAAVADDDDADEQSVDEDLALLRKAGAKEAKGAAKKNGKPKPSRGGDDAGGPSAQVLMREMLIKDMSMNVEDIMTALSKRGMKISRLTVSTTRSGFLSAVKALAKAGKLKGMDI